MSCQAMSDSVSVLGEEMELALIGEPNVEETQEELASDTLIDEEEELQVEEEVASTASPFEVVALEDSYEEEEE